MSPPKDSDWLPWSKFVLKELERLNEEHKELTFLLNKIDKKINLMQFKSSLWGGVAGSMPVLAYFVYEFIIRKR